jgi:DNA-binding CsgD family transcriptional regulator
MERDMFDDLAWPSIAVTLRLSARELAMTRCLVTDDAESAIAERLGISRQAFQDHLERVYRKVGVNSRLGLIAKVFSSHLLVAARAVDERAQILTDTATPPIWRAAGDARSEPRVPTRHHRHSGRGA